MVSNRAQKHAINFLTFTVAKMSSFKNFIDMLHLVFSSVSWDWQDFEQALSGPVRGQPPLLKEHIQDLLDSVLWGAFVLLVGLERRWSCFKDCDASLKDLRCTATAAHSLSKFLTAQDSSGTRGPKDVSALQVLHGPCRR